jgi:hypothetical protein
VLPHNGGFCETDASQNSDSIIPQMRQKTNLFHHCYIINVESNTKNESFLTFSD